MYSEIPLPSLVIEPDPDLYQCKVTRHEYMNLVSGTYTGENMQTPPGNRTQDLLAGSANHHASRWPSTAQTTTIKDFQISLLPAANHDDDDGMLGIAEARMDLSNSEHNASLVKRCLLAPLCLSTNRWGFLSKIQPRNDQ